MKNKSHNKMSHWLPVWDTALHEQHSTGVNPEEGGKMIRVLENMSCVETVK